MIMLSKTASFNKIISILGFNDNFKNFNLTLSSVVGGDEDKSRLIQVVYDAFVSNSKVIISDSNNRRDYIFLNDICKCIYILIANFMNNVETLYSNERIFCASGYRYKNREIVNIISNLLERDLDNFVFNQARDKPFSQSLNYTNYKFQSIVKSNPVDIQNLQIKDIINRCSPLKN